MATITKRGKSYLFRVYDGYTPDGRQRERTRTWTPPSDWSSKKAEKEAQHQAALFEEEIRSGVTENSNIRFSAFAEIWMQRYAEPNLKPKTIARYRGLLKKANQELGNIPLAKLQPQQLLSFYSDLRAAAPDNATYRCLVNFKSYLKEKGIKQTQLSQISGISVSVIGNICRKKNISGNTAQKISIALKVNPETLFEPIAPNNTLSPTTIRHYHRLICDILNDAVEWQYIPYNPCTKIKAPKIEQPEILYLDETQSKRLLELLRPCPGFYRRAIIADLLTGMRRGELLGLEWRDIDFSQQAARIVRTSQYLPNRGVYDDTPKNNSSKRFVMLSNHATRILQEQYQWQLLQKQRLGDSWQESGRVFTAPDGSPLKPDRLTHWFKRFIRTTDLPQINLHSLRHTYATLCIVNGMPLTAVAEQLGHSNVGTTARIYAHAIKSAQIAAANVVGDLLSEDFTDK